MPEVVGAELALEAVLGGGLRDRHDPRVVHEHVERPELVVDAGRALADRGQRLEVERADLGRGTGGLRLHRLERRRGLGGVAARQEHAGALGGQRLGRAEPQPAVRAGDQDRAAGLVRDVPGGPLPHRPILAAASVVDCIGGATAVPHLCDRAGLVGCPRAGRLLPAAARVGAARRRPGLGAAAPSVGRPAPVGTVVPGGGRARCGPCGPAHRPTSRCRSTSTSRSTTSKPASSGRSSAVPPMAEHQPQDDVRVMLDPAGHPFCLFHGEV